jgi:hypothetical protein
MTGSAGKFMPGPKSAKWLESKLMHRITLWNPHGENEVHDFDVIWFDCYALYSFVDISARP